MKKTLLIFLFCLVFSETSIAQIQQEFLQTWYLDYFAFDGGDFYVSSLGIPVGPNFTVTEDFLIAGFSFCNEFNGTFEYEPAGVFAIYDVFRPINIIRGTQNCNELEALETQYYVPFLAEAPADIIGLNGDFMVLQFFNPTTYQVYRNSPELSIQDNPLNSIKVFPNPTTEILNFENLLAPIDTMYLFDTTGTLVKSFSNISNQLTISEVNPGIYFLVIEQDGSKTVKRIVKQ